MARISYTGEASEGQKYDLPFDAVVLGSAADALDDYFDHLRAYRSQDSYVRRTLLSDNPAKASLTRTIRELVAA